MGDTRIQGALSNLGHRIARGTVAKLSKVVLMQRLLAAKRDLRLPQEFKKLDRFACIILDDIGYLQQDREEMEVFFTLLAKRYERRSVLAAIDRVVHRRVVLDLYPERRTLERWLEQQARAPRPERHGSNCLLSCGILTGKNRLGADNAALIEWR